ncbi:hypothetical protein KQI84_06760 [bacterium]|nr:hypothetical protein [bacterium]
MRRFAAILLICLIIPVLGRGAEVEPKKVYFTATDGMKVRGDLYMPWQNDAPFIVLFHRAGWSRGEYIPIAPKLNEMGYNCLAVDQRSGSRVYGLMNETAVLASQTGKSVEYIDAVPDMVGALQFVRDNYATGKLIGWGSSYSAGLIMVIATETKDEGLVDGVVAFSPGDYFDRFGMSETYVADHAAQMDKPIFMAFRQVEKGEMAKLSKALPKETPSKTFIPEGIGGTHGSQALWPESEGADQYWDALKSFLNTYFPSENPVPRTDDLPAKLRTRTGGGMNVGPANPGDKDRQHINPRYQVPSIGAGAQTEPVQEDPEAIPAGKPKEEKKLGPSLN